MAVEAFEEFRVVYIFSFCKVIGDYYRKTFFFFLCRDFHLHASFFVAVFHSVIQKDAEDLSEEFFFCPDVGAGWYTGFERLPLFSRHLLEVACDGFRSLGNIHVFQFHVFFFYFPDPGEGNKVVDKVRQAFRLFDNIPCPFALSADEFERFRIRRNDRHRCFQLVAGVCDEPFLVFHISHEGLDGLAGKKGDDEEEEDDAEETERHGVAEYRGEGEDVPGTVEKDNKGVTAGGLCDFIVVIGPVFKEEIFRFPYLENPYGEVEGFFGVECGDVVDVNDFRFLFVRVKENGEISRLIGEFRCFFRPVPEFEESFLLRREVGWDSAAVLRNDVGDGRYFMVHPDVKGAIDQSDGKDDDSHDGGGGHPYKFAVEPAYHIHRSTFCFCMSISGRRSGGGNRRFSLLLSVYFHERPRFFL